MIKFYKDGVFGENGVYLKARPGKPWFRLSFSASGETVSMLFGRDVLAVMSSQDWVYVDRLIEKTKEAMATVWCMWMSYVKDNGPCTEGALKLRKRLLDTFEEVEQPVVDIVEEQEATRRKEDGNRE